MQVTKIRRDFYCKQGNGIVSGPLASWATAARTGLPVTSRTKVETYTHWPRTGQNVALRGRTWAETLACVTWALLSLIA